MAVSQDRPRKKHTPLERAEKLIARQIRLLGSAARRDGRPVSAECSMEFGGFAASEFGQVLAAAEFLKKATELRLRALVLLDPSLKNNQTLTPEEMGERLRMIETMEKDDDGN